jgi:hypothetical protein
MDCIISPHFLQKSPRRRRPAYNPNCSKSLGQIQNLGYPTNRRPAATAIALAKEGLVAGGWTLQQRNTEEMLANSMAKLETGDIDLQSLLDSIRVADAKYETRWEKDDNELLAIPRFSDEDIKAVIKKYA